MSEHIIPHYSSSTLVLSRSTREPTKFSCLTTVEVFGQMDTHPGHDPIMVHLSGPRTGVLLHLLDRTRIGIPLHQVLVQGYPLPQTRSRQGYPPLLWAVSRKPFSRRPTARFPIDVWATPSPIPFPR